MTVGVDVSLRLDWIQVPNNCHQEFPSLDRGLSLAFILWHQVDGKVTISHIYNSTSFITSGKMWKKSSLFIQWLNKFGAWILLVWLSSLSFHSPETVLLQITRCRGTMYLRLLRCSLFVCVVWAQILIIFCCCHPLGCPSIILASSCLHFSQIE